MVVYTLLEKRTIAILRDIDPVRWSDHTYFFGQRLKYAKLKAALKAHQYTDSPLIDAFKLLNRTIPLIWLFFAAFLTLLAVSNMVSRSHW